MDTPNSKTGKPKKNTEPIPAVPAEARNQVRWGVNFAAFCAAAMSAPTLYELARMAKFPAVLAVLFPACIDGYAYTSMRFGKNLPVGHPARSAANRNARFALVITVVANGIYHLLAIAGTLIPAWVSIALLVAISALPPFMVDRLLHLRALADGTDIGTADGTPAAADNRAAAPTDRRRSAVPSAPTGADRPADAVPTQAPTAAPTAVTPAADDADPNADTDGPGADVIDMATRGAAAKRNTAQWAQEVLPIYRSYILNYGTEPNAPQLADAIAAAGLGTLGKSRARDVRAETQRLHRITPWDRADEPRPDAR